MVIKKNEYGSIGETPIDGCLKLAKYYATIGITHNMLYILDNYPTYFSEKTDCCLRDTTTKNHHVERTRIVS